MDINFEGHDAIVEYTPKELGLVFESAKKVLLWYATHRDVALPEDFAEYLLDIVDSTPIQGVECKISEPDLAFQADGLYSAANIWLENKPRKSERAMDLACEIRVRLDLD